MLSTLLHNGLIPDPLIRLGIRNLLKQRIREISPPPGKTLIEAKKAFFEKLKESPLALNTQDANEQHYEVPSEFYLYALGPNLKYSCAYFEGNETLEEAEEAMLERTVRTAQIQPGDKVLELGCGWGSLTLFMAKTFPD